MKPAYSYESFQFINILVQNNAISVKDDRFLEVYRTSPKMTSRSVSMNQEIWEDLTLERARDPLDRTDPTNERRERVQSEGQKEALEKRHFESENSVPTLMSHKSCPNGATDEIMV